MSEKFIVEGGLKVSSGKTLELGSISLDDVKDTVDAQSATALLTENAIVDYVAQQITAEDLDVSGDSGTIAIDLDSETFTIAGTANEITTAASGNTITVSLPDNVTIGDALTVTGASQMNSTVTVGVDDAGYDVKFFGDTASAYMLWDTSADDLVLAGAAGIDLAGDIDVDGTANLDDVDIDGNTQADGTITVGADDTGYDVKFFGDTASAYMLWDTSADDLVLAGTATLSVAGLTTLTGGATIPTGKDLTLTDQPTASTDAANKAYVDAQVTGSDLDLIIGSTSYDLDLTTEELKFAGTTNEIEVAFAESNAGQSDNVGTLTVGLPSDVTIGQDLTVTRNIDVDGTANLDAVDIDGNTQADGTITVGADDQGYDVKFFGDTASAYMLWDTSADDLVLAGAAGIDLAGDIDVDGTANLDTVDIDGNTQADGTITVGADDTGYDVKFFGDTASAYMLWDTSADDLVLAGAAGLSCAGTATFTAESVHTGGIDCNGDLSMEGNKISGTASEMIISADGDENSVSGSTDNSLSLNASGGIFTDDAVDMDSSLDVAGTVTMEAAATVGTTLGVTGVGTFTAQSVHTGGLEVGGNIVSDTTNTDSVGTSAILMKEVHTVENHMSNSMKSDFSKTGDASALEMFTFEAADYSAVKVVARIKHASNGDFTAKEMLFVVEADGSNPKFTEYGTISTGTEVAGTWAITNTADDTMSVTCNSDASTTVKGTFELIA
jgi:hypothetical protein